MMTTLRAIRVPSLILATTLALLLILPARAIRINPLDPVSEYNQAPIYSNVDQCEDPKRATAHTHIAMTLDSKYTRGTIAAVHSILKHAACPENIRLHFIANAAAAVPELTYIIKSSFPTLTFKIYPFKNEAKIKKLISSSIRAALDDPLNYARIYLSSILDHDVKRVVYLDSDTVVVDDIRKLYATTLTNSRVVGAPVYCHANFSSYFNDRFWSDRALSRVFEGRQACYFNTGVMVMDLERWREGERGGERDYTREIEGWMEVQRERRIYELGSLPPLMLVFGGEVEGVDHRWNQHGLGGDNVENSCRSLHPGPVSLMHWSGKGKPWVRLDAGRACPIDHLWAPYDLYKFSKTTIKNTRYSNET